MGSKDLSFISYSFEVSLSKPATYSTHFDNQFSVAASPLQLSVHFGPLYQHFLLWIREQQTRDYTKSVLV